jgi:hypothetical protein
MAKEFEHTMIRNEYHSCKILHIDDHPKLQ